MTGQVCERCRRRMARGTRSATRKNFGHFNGYLQTGAAGITPARPGRPHRRGKGRPRPYRRGPMHDPRGLDVFRLLAFAFQETEATTHHRLEGRRALQDHRTRACLCPVPAGQSVDMAPRRLTRSAGPNYRRHNRRLHSCLHLRRRRQLQHHPYLQSRRPLQKRLCWIHQHRRARPQDRWRASSRYPDRK